MCPVLLAVHGSTLLYNRGRLALIVFMYCRTANYNHSEWWWWWRCSLSVPRNYDPSLHPFEMCREYTRALNATKLERVLAKPFLAALDGHRDGVNCLAKHATSLSTLLSGSCDGEVTINHYSISWIRLCSCDAGFALPGILSYRIFHSSLTSGEIMEPD